MYNESTKVQTLGANIWPGFLHFSAFIIYVVLCSVTMIYVLPYSEIKDAVRYAPIHLYI